MMETVNDIIKSALSLGACSGSNGVTDWRSLVWLFFSPQGREFCAENDFPSLDMFRGMAGHVMPYGVYVDSGHVYVTKPGNIAVIGDGGKARVVASDYAVILLVNIGGEVEINKDNTVVIL